ncbi:uncharacterized protein DC041_0012206, partial [Schistosoma bovis]
KSRNEYTSLHVTLRQIDQEKDHLQICLDERTERCLTLERQLITNETSIKDLKINNETLEKRILRLTQSVIERESENRELVERLSKSECDLNSTVKNHELLTKELEKTKNEVNMLISEKQRLQSELNVSYDKQINLQAERFKLKVLASDQFKCLLFISGLNFPVDADVCMKLLSRMEHDDEMMLQTITTECQRLINLNQDAAVPETKSAAPSNSVHAVKTGQRQNSTKSHKYHSKTSKPATKC